MLFYHWTVVVKPAVQITQDDFYGVPLRFYWLMNEIHPTSFFFFDSSGIYLCCYMCPQQVMGT